MACHQRARDDGGNGGFVETSGASLQNYDHRPAAPKTPGTWLLDPTDLTITDNASTTSGFFAPFTLGAGPYTLNQGDLLTALQGGNVTLDVNNGSGGTGNITWQQPNATTFDISTLVNGPVLGSTLELDAPVSIQFNSITIRSVSGTGRLNLVLNSAFSQTGSVNLQNSTVSLNGGSFTANGIATTAGSPGVSVNGSSVTTTGAGNITIQGTGLLASGFDATGVLISGSTLTVGTVGVPGTGILDVHGYSIPVSLRLCRTPFSPIARTASRSVIRPSLPIRTIRWMTTEGLRGQQPEQRRRRFVREHGDRDFQWQEPNSRKG